VPALFGRTPPANKVFFYLNDTTLIGNYSITTTDGFCWCEVQVPLGVFSLTIKDNAGHILEKKSYISKNFAMMLALMSETLGGSDANLAETEKNTDETELSPEFIYPNVGVFFDFTIPKNWTFPMYRETVLGNGSSKPGLVNSFRYGGTRKGIIDTIKSICGVTPTIYQTYPQVKRWTIYTDPITPSPGSQAWVLRNSALPEGDTRHRISLQEQKTQRKKFTVEINGSSFTVSDSTIVKGGNQFFRTGVVGPTFDLSGLTLAFSVSIWESGSQTFWRVAQTTFAGAAMTPADIESQIKTSNTWLSDQFEVFLDATGRLCIGYQAYLDGRIVTLTVLEGTANARLGTVTGTTADIVADQLPVKYITNTLVVVDPSTLVTYTVGGGPEDLTIDWDSGRFVWPKNSAILNPEQGNPLTASYVTYFREEIEDLVDKVKKATDEIVFKWVP
jgi:hypothetical protein